MEYLIPWFLGFGAIYLFCYFTLIVSTAYVDLRETSNEYVHELIIEIVTKVVQVFENYERVVSSSVYSKLY